MNSIIKAAFKFLSHQRQALPGALIAVGVLAGIVATATASSNTSEEVIAYIQNLGDPDTVPESRELYIGSQTSAETITNAAGGQTELTCESKRYDLTECFDEIVALNPNADSLWAGSLVQGTSVPDGAPVTIPLERGGPIEITIVSSGGAVIGSRTVEVPSLAVVGQAVNDIVNTFEGDTAAKISFTKQEGYSFEQSMLQLGLSAKWFSGSLKASLDMDSKAETNSLYIKYVQEYYTVVTSPLRPDTVFAPQVTVDDLKFYANEANLPAYVSSVTYGRMLIIKMTSTAEHSELKAAFDYAYDPPGPNQGNVFVNAKNESILDNSSLDIVVLSSSAGDGIELIKLSTRQKSKTEV